MKSKTTLLIITALVFCAGLSRNVTACPGITLPAATTGNTMSFGVALVYALPILGLNAPSSPSQISDCIVVAADPNGAPVGINSAVMNDLYGSMNDLYGSGAWSSSRNGDPISATNRGQASGDAAVTWNTMMNALQAFLAGRPSLANFGLPANQTKAPSAPQTTKNCTNPAGHDSECTDQDGGAVTSEAAGGDAVVAEARGQVTVNENLGAEHAANAVVPPELNTILNLASFDVAAVPEPGTLVLFGMGLLVFGLWRVTRRRQ